MEEYANQKSTDNRIHLAVSPWDLTDGYNQHAGVTIASFLDNCHGEKAAVHLLYDERLNENNPEGAEENKKKYAALCEKFGAYLYYHHVELPEWVNELESVKKWTPGTLMRLYLPELLPDVSKILYVDCDTVINTDVRVIWNTQIQKSPLAAVPDSDRPKFSKKRIELLHSLKVDVSKYFCAGVILFNLEYLRQRDISLSKESMILLQRHPDLPFLDQDILNILFHRSYVPLPENYNKYMYYLDASVVEGILHYAASSKPWKGSHGERDFPYWHYLLQTPWGENHDGVLISILKLPNIAYLRDTDFATIYEQSGLPYVTLMKKIIPSIFTLTKKRVGAFIGNHLRFK